MSHAGALGPLQYQLTVSARCFDEVMQELKKLDFAMGTYLVTTGRVHVDGASLLDLSGVVLHRQSEPKLAPDGRDPRVFPCAGDCVVSANGKLRRLVTRTVRSGAPFEPRSIKPGSWIGYDVWYTKTNIVGEHCCWSATWQEWCRKNKVIVEAAS